MSRGYDGFSEAWLKEHYEHLGMPVPEDIRRQLAQRSKLNAMTVNDMDQTRILRSISMGNLREMQRKARAELDAEPDSVNPVLTLTLPLPPSVNHMYATVGGGRVLVEMAQEWKNLAGETAKIMASAKRWRLTRHSKIVIELTAYWPDDQYKRDMNNLHKPLADAFEGVLYANDFMALVRDMDFFTDPKNPRVELKIYQKELYE